MLWLYLGSGTRILVNLQAPQKNYWPSALSRRDVKTKAFAELDGGKIELAIGSIGI